MLAQLLAYEHADRIIKIKREYFILNLKMMQEASKRRCNKIKLLSLSFVSKLISQKILIKHIQGV